MKKKKTYFYEHVVCVFDGNNWIDTIQGTSGFPSENAAWEAAFSDGLTGRKGFRVGVEIDRAEVEAV